MLRKKILVRGASRHRIVYNAVPTGTPTAIEPYPYSLGSQVTWYSLFVTLRIYSEGSFSFDRLFKGVLNPYVHMVHWRSLIGTCLRYI